METMMKKIEMMKTIEKMKKEIEKMKKMIETSPTHQVSNISTPKRR